jgi:hypothetical protein
MKNKPTKQTYGKLVDKIASILSFARAQAVRQVNQILVKTYWEIGKEIVEHAQKGKEKADYGEKLLEMLSRDLTLKFGKGFTQSALRRMRQFYSTYPNCATLSHELSWSNNLLILETTQNPLEREFYLKMTIKERWSKRELEKQLDTDLFTRYMSSKKYWHWVTELGEFGLNT